MFNQLAGVMITYIPPGFWQGRLEWEVGGSSVICMFTLAEHWTLFTRLLARKPPRLFTSHYQQGSWSLPRKVFFISCATAFRYTYKCWNIFFSTPNYVLWNCIAEGELYSRPYVKCKLRFCHVELSEIGARLQVQAKCWLWLEKRRFPPRDNRFFSASVVH